METHTTEMDIWLLAHASGEWIASDWPECAIEPHRIGDREHVKFVAKQPCLICGRSPADAHHLRFAQHRALGRKVSDEFTVPLCRGHHREVHRCGDEAAWWKNAGTIRPPCPRAVAGDASAAATPDKMGTEGATSVATRHRPEKSQAWSAGQQTGPELQNEANNLDSINLVRSMHLTSSIL